MKIGVMVLDGPYQHQAADSAYHFVQAARARGHEIVGMFLFADGVNNANDSSTPPASATSASASTSLPPQGVPIVACTACAKFRGLKPDLKIEHVQLSGSAPSPTTCARPTASSPSATEEDTRERKGRHSDAQSRRTAASTRPRGSAP